MDRSTKISEKSEKNEADYALDGNAKRTVAQVVKVATACVQDGEKWFDIFAFRRLDCKLCHVAIARACSGSTKAVYAIFRSAGAVGAEHYTFAKTVATAVNASPAAIGTIVIRGGWFGAAGKQFTLPKGIVEADAADGESEKPLFVCLDFDQKKYWQLVVKDGSHAQSNLKIDCRGSTRKWKSSIAEQARVSAPMMLCISAAFAAPLLKLLGVTPFTILLTGRSTGGKTTITVAGSSVIGMGGEKDIYSWNMTEAGLEQRAEIHADMLLPIDDLANAGGSPTDIFRWITEVPYRITSGSRRETLTSAKSGITGRPRPSEGISTIIVTSYEASLDQIASAAKGTIRDGVCVRIIEIPVARPEAGGVFDLLPAKGSPAERVERANGLAEQITRACMKNHGWVFRKWLNALIKDPNAARKYVRHAITEFMAAATIDRARPVELRHAARFAFLYGAAAYAIDRKLLPWTHDELRSAILKCHASSRIAIPQYVDEVKDGISRLRERLRDNRRVVKSSDVANVSSIDGWWTTQGGRKTYYVVGICWRTFFASDTQRKLVESELEKRGILNRGADGKRTRQVQLPNSAKKAPRCYVLRAPKPKKLPEARQIGNRGSQKISRPKYR